MSRNDSERIAMESEVFAEPRPPTFSIAYRLLGSVSEAEDVVQEAFLRFHQSLSRDMSIASPRSYLGTITTRTSIDHLRRARARREKCGRVAPGARPRGAAGEPCRARGDRGFALVGVPRPARDSLTGSSSGLPASRRLRHDYGEIAAIVGKSEQNCRQLVARARRLVDERKPRFESWREQRDELARRSFDAVENGDTEGSLALLAADAAV